MQKRKVELKVVKKHNKGKHIADKLSEKRKCIDIFHESDFHLTKLSSSSILSIPNKDNIIYFVEISIRNRL